MAFNPKNRKLDKRGNPIVTKEELEASGMSLRDFLNKERGLTRRGGSKPDITKPMQAPAVKANPMADQKDTDERVMMGETRKRAAAPISRGDVEADYKAKMKDIIKEKAAKEREEQYGSGMKCGGKVHKKMASGGSVRGDGIAKRGKTRGRMC